MILAAGRGERLRPLTDFTPKPLVRVGDRTLIEHHLKKFCTMGLKHIVINTSYLSEKIEKYVGSGDKYNLRISYSNEPDGPLGTAGGIVNALNLLEQDTFYVVNSDIFTDYNFSQLRLADSFKAHLVVVPNPLHNINGDYNSDDGVIQHSTNHMAEYTFSGIGIYRRKLFEGILPEFEGLANTLQEPIDNREVSGEVHHGLWIDVGNLERLEQARTQYRNPV